MNSIAFSIGNFEIHWYGIFVATGFLIGFWTANRRGLRYGFSREQTADLAPWILIGALIGARTFYVIGYWDESFSGKNWIDIFKIREGGLVFYGGFLGASLSTILYARQRKIDIWKLADILSPSIALGHAFGRIGCLMTGCCYGKICEMAWAIRFPKGHFTHPESLHPTQIYEAVLNFFLYIALEILCRKKNFVGQSFAIYLMSYGLLRGFVECFRGDYAEAQIIIFLTPGQRISIIIFIAGAIIYGMKSAKSKRVSSNSKSSK